MKIQQILLSLILATGVFSVIATDAIPYQTQQAVNAYAKAKHGIDGSLFLDPYFIPFIEVMTGKKILDAGCGAGPWSILAAQYGAQVFAIDLQAGMVERAMQDAYKAGVLQKINFTTGSVAQLPYEDNFFDAAISINVACCLPQDIFVKQMQELYRVLKPGGVVVITLPTSFDTVFVTGEHNWQAKEDIQAILDSGLDLVATTQRLGNLSDVLRSTFVMKNNQLVLVEDEKELQEGMSIWRKIPGLSVPNFYHSESSYISELRDAGFEIEKIYRPCFESKQAWENSECKVGKEYSYFHPFAVIYASK